MSGIWIVYPTSKKNITFPTNAKPTLQLPQRPNQWCNQTASGLKRLEPWASQWRGFFLRLFPAIEKRARECWTFSPTPLSARFFLGPTTIKLLLVTKTILHAYYTLSEENLVKARKELQKHESCNSILNIIINPIWNSLKNDAKTIFSIKSQLLYHWARDA